MMLQEKEGKRSKKEHRKKTRKEEKEEEEDEGEVTKYIFHFSFSIIAPYHACTYTH